MFNTNDEMKKLIRQCIEIRKEKRLTQKDIAELSGLTQQMVSRIETLMHIPTLDNYLLYLNALGIKITFNDV